MEKQEENGHFCSMGMLRKVGTGEEGQGSSGKAARCDALIFACITRGLGVLERSWLKWEGAGWNCSKKAGDETQGKTSLLRSTGRQSQGTLVPLAGGWETQVGGGGPRDLAPPILHSGQGVWGGRTSVGTGGERRKASSPKPILKRAAGPPTHAIWR